MDLKYVVTRIFGAELMIGAVVIWCVLKILFAKYKKRKVDLGEPVKKDEYHGRMNTHFYIRAKLIKDNSKDSKLNQIINRYNLWLKIGFMFAVLNAILGMIITLSFENI